MQHVGEIKFVSRKSQVLFHRLKAGITKAGYTDADVFHHIGELMLVNPEIARALCLFIRDVVFDIQAQDDVAYHDILAEGYRRLLFDPQHFHRYGTFAPCHDDAALMAFVESVVNAQADHSDDTKVAPFSLQLH